MQYQASAPGTKSGGGGSEFSWLPFLSGGWGQVSGYSPPIPNCSHPRPDSLVQTLLHLAKDQHGPLPLISLEAVWITLVVSWLMRREGSGEGLQAQDQCPVPWPQLWLSLFGMRGWTWPHSGIS